MSVENVYVITLQFDTATFQWLQALRTRHFPAERNWLPAHLTLFHAVTANQKNLLKQRWSQFDRFTPPALHFTGYRSLGRGTALAVASPQLEVMRTLMMQTMAGDFSAQDLQPFKAHVTVQNKVDPAAAKALLGHLSATFLPREGTGSGTMIWRYLGGPWALEMVLPFKN